MQTKDRIELVKTFHEVYNHPVGTEINTANQTLGKQRADFIRSELKEYEEAVENNDIVGIADALADALYFIYGTIVIHGLHEDFNRIFQAVHSSNMGKICTTLKEAETTKEHYSQGTHHASPGVVEATYIEKLSTPEFDYYVVKREDDNKVLKSVKWIKPEVMIESIIQTSLIKK